MKNATNATNEAIQTAGQAIAWIEANTNEDDATEALLWFVSSQEAEEMKETYDADDWAHVAHYGIPEQTEQTAMQWLDDAVAALAEEGETYDAVADLRTHFGV